MEHSETEVTTMSRGCLSQTYVRVGLLGLLLVLCAYLLLYTDHSPEMTVPEPTVKEQVQCQRKLEREPEEYSAGDQPDLQFVRKYGHLNSLPTEEELHKLSQKEIFFMYHSYLDNMDHLCRRKLRMGNVGDGGWEVCDDYEYRPLQPCIVYSFGINNDFSFDDDVAKLYRCKVFAFDPSMNRSTHQRSDRVYFFNVGLGGADGKLPPHVAQVAAKKQWNIQSFDSIRKMLKHDQTPIDIIKMDIEHSEWPALDDMADTGHLLDVRQLVLEVHDVKRTADVIRKKLAILAKLEGQGFRRFFTHMNKGCGIQRKVYVNTRAACYEIYLVNTNFARQAKKQLR